MLAAVKTSLVAQMVKNLPAKGETWVRSLGWEDPLEEGMATHSSILAWRIPKRWTTEGQYIEAIFYLFILHQFSLVQSRSVQLCATPWTAAHQASLSITSSRSLLKLMPIELVMPSIHLILCRPFLFPPSTFPSIRVFSSEFIFSHQVAKVLEFQLQHQSFQ